MAPPLPPVIIYQYDTSPFSHKIDNVLVLKNITHYKVDVSPTLPRPEITDLLGIAYRRIPILAIGNDIYCDTSLIASALERRFPVSAGYGTIFPRPKHGGSPDTGMVKAFARYYADAVLFPAAPSLIPWEKLPPSFVEDRSMFFGATINVDTIIASRGKSLTVLSSHLSLVEEQLDDGREWLFDTELPSFADISIHFIFNWLKGFKAARALYDAAALPHTLKWLDRMSAFINKKRLAQVASQKLSGAQAATLIVSSEPESYDVVGFDNAEAERIGLKLGAIAQVFPDDTGRNYPTFGKLVGLNMDEAVFEVQGPQGLLRCHFPRLGFTILPGRLPRL
ncbi:hypothetical protein BDZ94DRAFT_1260819 [Collybia nuda]|uniref:GST N-terminal domain-containing protein n=1 Tax=Collybia nuda TaxID=64659 RepID=A0A9P5Y7J1_9AGAR|nr:hypothetical protein BDZ94DRAFT_1260819 [Collybia nuda]